MRLRFSTHGFTSGTRVLTVASLLLLIASFTLAYAVHSAGQSESRGTVTDFPLPIQGADALRVGVNAPLDTYTPDVLNARLADLQQRGVRYVRQEFRWADIEKQQGVFDWSASDRVLSAARAHDLQVLSVLIATPKWARPDSGSLQAPSPESTPPADFDTFARFATAFAERYDVGGKGMGGGGTSSSPFPLPPILGYQIWDEPNLSSGWGNNLISPAAYLKLLFAVGDAIRAVNPQARIVLAALAPTVEANQVNLAPQEFLRRLYQLGGHDAFDVVAAKPYGFELSPLDTRVSASLLNFSHVILMREVMVAHGDGQKAIWATEFGWNALPPNWTGEASIWGNTTEQKQAEFLEQAIDRAAHEWPWMGAMFVDALEPRPRENEPEWNAEWGFALLTLQGQPRPAFDALTTAIRDAELAPRGNSFAVCGLPPRLMKQYLDPNLVRDKSDAMNAIPLEVKQCYQPNPQAHFTDGWRFSELGADIPQEPGAKVTVPFKGDSFALTVRRAGREYRAYTFVSIDGQPANLLPQEPRGAYLIMNSADFTPRIETIPVASGLGSGEHVAEITLDGGWNLWGLVGWSSRFTTPEQPLNIASGLLVALGLVGLIGLVWAAPRGQWHMAFAGIRPRLQGKVSILPWHAALIGVLTWLAASLTWAQDAASAYRNLGTPAPFVISALASAVAFWSPVYVLSLIALVALFVLVLLRLDLGLMLLSFFIPFYLQPQRLFERSFSMVELLTVMCAVSWLVAKVLATRPWHRPKRLSLLPLKTWLKSLSLLDISVLALVVVSLLSSLQAEFQVEAFRELRVVIGEAALVYFILRSSHLSEAQRWYVVDGFVAGATLVAGIGLFNYVRGDRVIAEFGLPRIKSVFGSPNNDALYLGRAFPVLLAVALLRRKPWLTKSSLLHPLAISDPRSLLYALALLPVTLALLLSQSRGALLLGLPAAVATVCWFAGRRWRWVAIVIFVTVILGFAVLLSDAPIPFLANTRLSNALDLQRGTGFFRLNLWQSALRMWADHPLLGVGPDNFLYAYRSFYILPAAWQEPNLSHPHNIVLDFATRLGTLGLLAGICLMVGLVNNFAAVLRNGEPSSISQRALAIGFLGLMAEMIAHGLVDNSFFSIELAFPLLLVAGLSAMTNTPKEKQTEA